MKASRLTLVFALSGLLMLAMGGGAPLRAAESGEPSRMMPRPLAWAFSAMGRGDWDRAALIARRDGPQAEEVVEWSRLRAGRGSPAEVLVFLAAHPDWPGLRLLRRQSEEAFEDATDAQVLALFDTLAPQTPDGALLYARALRRAGRGAEADATLVAAWRDMPMSEREEETFLAAHAALLAPAHAARAEAMFWAGEPDDQKRMADRLPDDAAALSEARRLARAGAPGAADAVGALPQEARRDPALAYARFRAAVAAGRDDTARDILLTQSEIPGGLGRPDLWANERGVWAREEMRRGDPDLAYRLAAHHQLTGGGDFADLEWLAGYIALRRLDAPDTALDHFRTLQQGVATPISLGRAWYWIGRAHEALGEDEAAQRAYMAGAGQQTSFYGLLAAEKAGVPFDVTLAGGEEAPDWRGTDVERAPLRRLAMLLDASGQPATGEYFLMHYASGLDEADTRRLAALLRARGEAHLAVRLGKLAARDGLILPDAYFALHPLTDLSLPVPPEMALAIARRESEFDATARSHVGARGLMQLMPATAEHVAGALGVEHQAAWLTDGWRHNAVLGSAYLAELARDFGGNVVLMSVGYNAGPSRARRWSELFGDPRDPDVDIVDWIEGIPFRETRNYVQRIAESLPVYRARLGLEPLPVMFSVELKGSTLAPLSP